MDMLAPTDAIDWTVDFDQAITAATWSVVPSGTVTATALSINTDTGVATASIAGNGATVGHVYEVRCTASLAGGLTDVRTLTFRIGPKAVS